MTQPKVNPKTAVPAKLYKAALNYVNRLRETAGCEKLSELPPGLPGIEGCPIGKALQPLHSSYTPYQLPYRIGSKVYDGTEDDDDDNYDWDQEDADSSPVRVTTFGAHTKIRLRSKKSKKFRVIVAPLYITKFLNAFEKKAEEVLK